MRIQQTPEPDHLLSNKQTRREKGNEATLFSFSSTSDSKQTHLFTAEQEGEECQQAFTHTSCLLLFLPLNSFGCYIRTYSVFSLLHFFPRPLGFSDLIKRGSSVMLLREFNFSFSLFPLKTWTELASVGGVLKGFYSCLCVYQTHNVSFLTFEIWS